MVNNILSTDTCDTIADLLSVWARTPPELKIRVAHVPTLAVARAIKCTLANDSNAGHYNTLHLNDLKQKLHRILCEGQYQETSDPPTPCRTGRTTYAKCFA